MIGKDYDAAVAEVSNNALRDIMDDTPNGGDSLRFVADVLSRMVCALPDISAAVELKRRNEQRREMLDRLIEFAEERFDLTWLLRVIKYYGGVDKITPSNVRDAMKDPDHFVDHGDACMASKTFQPI